MLKWEKVASITLALVALIVMSAGPTPAAPVPYQGELLVFRMMIVVTDEEGDKRAEGGQVELAMEGGETTIHPIDGDGLLSFTIPAGTMSRATFSGAFVPYTLRFQFEDGFLAVYNDALPETAQEARVHYYLALDGSYVVEYHQDYLYMLAQADPGGPVLGPLMTRVTTGSAESQGAEGRLGFDVPGNGDGPGGGPGGGLGDPGVPDQVALVGFCLNLLTGTGWYARDPLVQEIGRLLGQTLTFVQAVEYCQDVFDNTIPNAETDQEEQEIPALEICLVRPDKEISFLEWVNLGDTGTIGEGFNWASNFEWLEDSLRINLALELSPEFLEGLPEGWNYIAYRLIDSQGRGSNQRLFILAK